MRYESPISSGKKVMVKVTVFVHASNVEVDTDTRAMTLASQIFVPAHQNCSLLSQNNYIP